MKRISNLFAAVAIVVAAGSASAATPTSSPFPASKVPRASQASSVTQSIGLVTVKIDYSSPLVHAMDGTDRRGMIWGKLVPYGPMKNPGFGTCTECPWRAGANENTTFTTSHDITVEGQKLPAGTYGLFMFPDPDEWTVIFNRNHTAWGGFFYDAADDQLRVKVKPVKAEYHEALTYDFIDRHADHATLALQWEVLSVPIRIAVPDSDELYMASMRQEMQSEPGFDYQNVMAASQFALAHKHPEEGLQWAQYAVSGPFVGRVEFQTLMNLADAQEANGKTAEATATREKVFNLASTASVTDLHLYARQLLNRKHKEEAIRFWNLNAKLHPDVWPVNVGLARASSAAGNYAEAIKYAKLAAAQAPDEADRRALEGAIKKLEAGQDMN
jgi:hypothetical protein